MRDRVEDTIFALATAQGKAGVAVVRLSGPQSCDVLACLGSAPPPPRGSRLAVLRDGEGQILDHALILHFAHGASFTGELVIELHLHGSIAVVRAVLNAIAETGLARMAEPGEFTRRALVNGRLDLTQVQGLGDVIDAETEAQRKHAMRVMGGEMAERVGAWRRDLIRAIALTEATIDFADEEVPEDVTDEVVALIEGVLASVEVERTAAKGLARLKSGFEVALIGAPNVGKSSLLNALTRSDAAIVTEVAGTTRDVIEFRCDINGLPVTILDTAGLRETEDAVEKIGVGRALARAEAADLRVLLHEEREPPTWPIVRREDDITLRSKADLHGGKGISAKSGAGIEALLTQIGTRLSARLSDSGLVSQARDRAALAEAADAMRSVLDEMVLAEPEITSLRLRDAAGALQQIIGGVDIEQILDEVFASFCLGK